MAVVVKISNIDRSSLVEMGSLVVRDQINQATDTAEFTILKHAGQDILPAVNQEVIIEVDSVRIFGGVIIELESQLDGHHILRYKITCKDFSHFMDRLMVTERYTNTNMQAVVLDLIDRYVDDYGFTGTNVAGDTVQIASISFSEVPLSECLNKLSSLTNYLWYVDNMKDIHLFQKNDEMAPFSITDDSDNYIPESLVIKQDFSQIRNKVKVRGGEAIGESRTELLTGDGETHTFPLGNKFSEIPTIEVDGSPVTVGNDFLDEDDDFDVMWNYQQKFIRFTTGNIPAAPGSGATNIEVTGLPLKPIVVERTNALSIATYGLYEHSIRNDSIRSRDEALQFAQADLQSYADKIRAGSFDTYTPGLKSGQTININSVLRGFNEDFVLQSVMFRMLTKTQYQWTVEIATVKTLSHIDFLQKLLLRDRIEVGEDETLLSFFNFEDTFSMTDSLVSVTTTTSEDYVVEQNDPGSDSYSNPAIVNKCTMSS